MIELRRNILFNRWIVTGTLTREEFFSEHQPMDAHTTCPFCDHTTEVFGREIMRYTETSDVPWEVKVVEAKERVLRRDVTLDRRGYGPYDASNNLGSFEVVIETPHHIPYLYELTDEHIKKVFKVFQMRIKALDDDHRLQYPIVYKNEKSAAYAALNHTYSYIAGLPVIPKDVKDKLRCARDYYDYKERCIFCDIVHEEMRSAQRLVDENAQYIAFVPFAPSMPFEVYIYPKRHHHDITHEGDESLRALARILRSALKRLRVALHNPPISFVVNTTPFLRPREGYWHSIERDYHWHIEIIPQLRGMRGYEIGAGCYIEPLLPEACAHILREVEITL